MTSTSPILPACLDQVPLLRDRPITSGERWIYSAGFNVGPDLANTTRIDCELEDLLRLSAGGARTAILAHQGNRHDGTARHLDFVAEYLERRLGRPVPYISDPLAPETPTKLRQLDAGGIALVGNTRLLPGEEEGNSELSRQLASLGDSVAIGGFSKAHRAHASNVGLLRQLPGYAADSVVEELAELAPWADVDDGRFSVAALGGLKREKIDPGLIGLADRYDLLIPGGAVLNALLAVNGYEIGASSVGECLDAAGRSTALLEGCKARIHLPTEVVIAPVRHTQPGLARTVSIAEGVPADHSIVDFLLTRETLSQLASMTSGRILIAGPPGLCAAGFRRATDPLLEAMGKHRVDSLLLGGDTVQDLPWDGPASAGGGSALLFLTTGECPVLKAMTKGARA